LATTTQMFDWATRVGLARKIGIALSVTALATGTATFFVIGDATPMGAEPDVVILLININLFVLLLLGVVIGRQIAKLWAQRRQGAAGARLHGRLVFLFGLVAVIPAMIVASFSVAFFQFGIDSWFNDRIRTAIDESRRVATAYLDEHKQAIRTDVLVMAMELSQPFFQVYRPQEMNKALHQQRIARSLDEVVLFNGDRRVYGRSHWLMTRPEEQSGLMWAPRVPDWAMEQAKQGQVAVTTEDQLNMVQGLIQVNQRWDLYLLVSRRIDPQVLATVQRAREAADEYENLLGQQSSLQISSAGLLAVVSLLLLLAAIWIGISFASHLSAPIRALVAAADRVRSGDLTARVTEKESEDELAVLTRTFNRMTEQLGSQRSELVEAHEQAEIRRAFTEAVLAGVSAGVIGIDERERINLVNPIARDILGRPTEALLDRDLVEIVPELADTLRAAERRPDRLARGQITLDATDGRPRTLLVRIAAQKARDGAIEGYVVTFDDISELVAAQRKAAWADVARRIAHEIKNPLTPIQLSAERLKRKYLGEIGSDPETFATCTDTIVRQVGDIRRMVDEFSAFARMPAPSIDWEPLDRLCNEALILPRSAHPGIRFEADCDSRPVSLRCDRRQVGQVLTNLIQNAVDSIAERPPGPDGEAPEPGIVRVQLAQTTDTVILTVEDNGRGLPNENRDRLTEPYVTTRQKGTGLGLAIVRKIMEDHRGDIQLADRPGGGARVTLTFPIDPGDAARLPGPPAETSRTGPPGDGNDGQAAAE